MIELTTERLLLRPFTDADVDFVLDVYSRAEVQRYIGRAPRVMADRAEARAAVARYASFDDGVRGAWLIADRETGARFGNLLLKSLPASADEEPLPPSGETEIGWHLHPTAMHRGIATEAAARVLAHAFESGLPRVLAVTHPDNHASQAVARRIGMADAGLTDAYYGTTCRLFRLEGGSGLTDRSCRP